MKLLQLGDPHECPVAMQPIWPLVAIPTKCHAKPVCRALRHSLPFPDVVHACRDAWLAEGGAEHTVYFCDFGHVAFAGGRTHSNSPLLCMNSTGCLPPFC